MRRLISFVKPGLVAFIGLINLLWAGPTGKIAGIVTDKTTGEPILGANVVVTGTSFGAATDENGQYTILYIPPGTYNVAVSVIGFEKMTMSEVVVQSTELPGSILI
jgi:hypothetical protein